MKLSIDIPGTWSERLRLAATDAKCKSVQAYLRRLIAADLGVPNEPKTWGGKRDKPKVESKQLDRAYTLDELRLKLLRNEDFED